MTDRELMQQALEALEYARGELAAYHEDAQGEDYNNPALNDTITALRERLAQPEQEPVGEIVQAFADLTAVSIPVMPPVGTKLYTTPPHREWVGLTAQEAADCWSTSATKTWQAIEAKLREKNA